MFTSAQSAVRLRGMSDYRVPQGIPDEAKTRRTLAIAAVLLIGAIVLYAVFSNDSPRSSAVDAEPTTNVWYVVRASQSSITYTTPGGMEQISRHSGSWSHRFNTDRAQSVGVTVQDQTGNANAEVTCEIRIDGSVTESATSHGAFAIAQCSGFAR